MASITSFAESHVQNQFNSLITTIRDMELLTGRSAFKCDEIKVPLSGTSLSKSFLKSAKQAGIVQQKDELISLAPNLPNVVTASRHVSTVAKRGLIRNLQFEATSYKPFRPFTLVFRSHKSWLTAASAVGIATAAVTFYPTPFW
jgi:hypothetical protein